MNQNFKKQVIERSLSDIQVKLDDEFQENFERKAFFTKEWPERKYDDEKGSLLIRSGALRRSLRSRRRGSGLSYTSNKPYAGVHNEGGEIKVSKRMKKYFWAKHYETSGKISRKKDGAKRGTKSNTVLSDTAEFYKNMALKKEGSTIKMPERRFVGFSPETDKIVKDVVNHNVKEYFDNIIPPVK